MPEASPTIQDEAGVTRTPTGTIVDQSPTSTPAETIVRPPPTPSTTPSQTTEAKADGKEAAKPAEAGKSLLNEKGAPEGAPEKYEAFNVPEGFTLDEDIAKDANALFKKHNLSQAGAQELVDFYVKQTKEAFEAPFNAYMDKRQEWRDNINKDPDIGGSKLNGVKVSIGKLIDSFGDPKVAEAFREAMDYTGAGDNPAVVKGLYALALRLTEGGPVRGSRPVELRDQGRIVVDPNGAGRPSAAQAIYPHLNSKG